MKCPGETGAAGRTVAASFVAIPLKTSVLAAWLQLYENNACGGCTSLSDLEDEDGEWHRCKNHATPISTETTSP